MSNLEWAECRELILHGLSNRQITRQEAAGKAEQARIEAEQERRLREGKRFADSCEAQGGYVSKWQAYLDGRVDQPECRGLAAARERARKEQECLRGGGVWEPVSRTVSARKCRCAVAGSSWNPSLMRCETYEARNERQARERCLSEAGATWDPSHKRHGPCVTPKERRQEKRDRELARCRKAYEAANTEQYDQRRVGAIDGKEFKSLQKQIRSAFTECERQARN